MTMRTGSDYLESIRDGRDVWIEGERVRDVTKHPALAPIIQARADVYDMVRGDEDRLRENPSAPVALAKTDQDGEARNTLLVRPRQKEDWYAKWEAHDEISRRVGGLFSRLGDDNLGEMWSVTDERERLEGLDNAFVDNVERHLRAIETSDVYHVSANTDPKGDRSKNPKDQDPDMLLHVVKETDRGIVVRGAKFETASLYANQAFVKPTITNWGDATLSPYAVGFVVQMNAPGLKHICRTTFTDAGKADDYPLSSRLDEVEALMIFDDVEIPWEDVFFYENTRAALIVRSSIHRYASFSMLLRLLKSAELLLGISHLNVEQTGLHRQQAVMEKLSILASYHESIRSHLIAAIESGSVSGSGLWVPHQSMLFSGRYSAVRDLPGMMHIARELTGGQIALTPDSKSFEQPEIAPYLEKYFGLSEEWPGEDRRRLLALARDFLNSGYAGHKLSFQLFSQAPPFAHLAAIFNSFDFEPSKSFTRQCARIGEEARGSA